MGRCRKRLCLAIVALVPLTAGPVFSQQRSDPIGAMIKVSVFDRAQQIFVGRMRSDQMACYVREEGSSHSLDIGVTADHSFIRLETGDSREATPTPPVRVFAGKQGSNRVGNNEYASDEYALLQEYVGDIEYFVPNPDRGDFVLVARGDAKAFLEMVARARTEFVVVQSATNKKSTDIVAIYKFTNAKVLALLSCARSRLQ